MKKCLFLFLFFGLSPVFAQEEGLGSEVPTLSEVVTTEKKEEILAVAEVVEAKEEEEFAKASVDTKEFAEKDIVPAILTEEYVRLGEISAFDASDSKLLSRSEFGSPVYWWDFGDGSSVKYGKKASHRYEKPGRYTIKLSVKQGRKKETTFKDVFIFDKKAVLISDDIEAISGVILQGARRGIWVKEISFQKDESGFSAEEEFMAKIQENMEFVKESSLLIFHTKSVVGLQSFLQVWKKLSEEHKFELTDKLWVQLVDDSLDQVAKLAQPIFQVLHPHFILLTRTEALNPIFEHFEVSRITEMLKSRAIEYRIIDDRTRRSPFLVFSQLITYFVSHGISQNVVYLLLVVPFLTFLTAFVRQVLGVSTYGVYAPLILSLSFFVLGVQFGLIVFLITLFVSYLIRVVFEKVELLYIPRLSLLLSALALSFFLVLGLAVYFQTSLNLSLTIFPMLVMSTVSEKFLSAQSEEGMKNAIIVAGETVLISLGGYFLFDWAFLKDSILAVPELLLLPILGNIWLGRFTGLRLTEYIKFRSLLREDSQE